MLYESLYSWLDVTQQVHNINSTFVWSGGCLVQSLKVSYPLKSFTFSLQKVSTPLPFCASSVAVQLQTAMSFRYSLSLICQPSIQSPTSPPCPLNCASFSVRFALTLCWLLQEWVYDFWQEQHWTETNEENTHFCSAQEHWLAGDSFRCWLHISDQVWTVTEGYTYKRRRQEREE